MRKKHGFTLAEVLITLGIIGVVSALTAPSLMSSFQKSKVGPSLKKFMNTIETANQHIMTDEGADTLSGAVGSPYIVDYLKKLQTAVKGRYMGPDISSIDTSAMTPIYYDGGSVPTPSYVFQFNDGSSMGGTFAFAPTATTVAGASAYTGFFSGYPFYYDINGFQNAPNRLGKDIFVFIIDESGTVVPYGSKISSEVYGTAYWNTPAPSGCAETSPTTTLVINGLTCAGSVIDNDGKVIYKY